MGAELVRDPLANAVALNDVAGLDIIRENDLLVPDRTARFLDRGHTPLAVSFARPEREARSVWTIEKAPACDPPRDLEFLPSPWAPRLPHPE